MTFTLRDYQQRTREKVNKCLDAGGNPLIVMDTGTGKTKTDCAIIADRVAKGQRVYVIVPSREIFRQWLDDLSFLDPGYINDEGLRGKNRSVYVCMMQSLYNNLSMIPESIYPDELHTDEAHHSAANTLESIYDFFGKAQRLGMTATPIRTDGKPLGHLYTEIISEINIQEALEFGFLTQPILYPPEEYIDKIPMNGTDFDVEVQADILGEPRIIGNVIETYTTALCGAPCLVACCTYDHAEKMTAEFNKAGWIAEHIHSKLPDHVREGMTKRISNGKTNLLVTVGIGIEGWDCPALYGIIWLRRTRSVTIWKQFNGRAMRLAEGKEVCAVIDPVGNTVIHGMPDRIHKWSLTEGEEIDDEDKVPFVKCWSCGTYNNPDNLECHWCGADLSEEGKIPGTCRTCKHQKQDHCCFECKLWEKFPGCPSWQSRGRKLPAIIDGKLVAITTDGQLHDIKQRAEEKKEEQQLRLKLEEEKRNKPEKITAFEKRKALSKGLFASGMRRSLLQDALSEWE